MAPHVRAAGPLITHAGRSALNLDAEIYTFLPMATTAEVQASVTRLKAMGSSAVKVWYLAPSAERRAELDARVLGAGAGARGVGRGLAGAVGRAPARARRRDAGRRRGRACSRPRPHRPRHRIARSEGCTSGGSGPSGSQRGRSARGPGVSRPAGKE